MGGTPAGEAMMLRYPHRHGALFKPPTSEGITVLPFSLNANLVQ